MPRKFGTILGNTIYDLHLDFSSLKRYDALNVHLEKEGFEPISIHGGHVDTKELHEAIMECVKKKSDVCKPFTAQGGSCHTIIKAASAIGKAVWGDERIHIEHISTSAIENALVIKLPKHRKILPDRTMVLASDYFLCANREAPKMTELQSVQQRNIAYGGFFVAPFSTIQDFPAVIREAMDAINDYKPDMGIVMTLRCNYDKRATGEAINPVKKESWKFLLNANVLIGDEKALSAPEIASKLEEFLERRGTILVTLKRKPQGIEVLRNGSYVFSPYVQVPQGKGLSAGEGSGATAAFVHYMAKTNKDFGNIHNRTIQAAKMASAAETAIRTIPETALGDEHVPLIAKYYSRMMNVAPLTI